MTDYLLFPSFGTMYTLKLYENPKAIVNIRISRCIYEITKLTDYDISKVVQYLIKYLIEQQSIVIYSKSDGSIMVHFPFSKRRKHFQFIAYFLLRILELAAELDTYKMHIIENTKQSIKIRLAINTEELLTSTEYEKISDRFIIASYK